MVTAGPVHDAAVLAGRQRTYWQLVGHSGADLDTVAAVMGITREEVVGLVAPLLRNEIARVTSEDILVVLPPNEAVARLVRAESVRARGAVARLESLAEALEITAVQPSPGDGATIDGELVADERIPERLAGWIHHTSGELMWLRPDQWRLPDHRELANAIRQAHLAGRRVRAIYPVQALHDAPEILRQRARIGERIRVAPVVTLRLAVIGQRALVQEPRGHARLSRIVLRQPVLVDILRDFFQQAWDRAVPVPELALGDPRADQRRLLLAELAAGAKDEQIARTLGISLRTVRRRVAALLTDLGVDTRFQAGAEAARQGWL